MKQADGATLVERNMGRRVWTVWLNGRRYTAIEHTIGGRTGSWQVDNSRGAHLARWGETAMRVIALCEAAFAKIEGEHESA